LSIVGYSSFAMKKAVTILQDSSFLIVIVLFTSLIVASAGCSKKEQKNGVRADNERKKEKEPRPEKDAALSQWALGERPWSAQKAHFSLNAEAFVKEFTADHEVAKSKYEDKVVELTGEVNEVRGLYGTKTVTITVGRATKVSGTFVQCFLAPEHKAKGLRLSINQKVKLTGGFEHAPAYIILGNCRLEELSKSDILHVSSGDLVREFSKDPEAAKEKYRDQWVIVSGEVEDLPQDGGFHKARLKGDRKMGVSVTFAPPWASDEQSLLKKGQMVRLRAQCTSPFIDNKEIALYGGFIVEAK
jgi:hypothetical protein